MKPTRRIHVLVACVVLSPLFATTAPAQWEIVASPPQDAVEVLHPAGEELFAGSYLGKVFVSTDLAESWQEIGALDHALPVSALVLHDDWLLISRSSWAGNHRAHREAEGWSQWEPLPLFEALISSFTAVGPRLYAVIDGAVHYTEDHGTTWIPTPAPEPRVSSIFHARGALFAVTQVLNENQGRLYRSSDGGQIWQDVSGPLYPLPFTDHVVFHDAIYATKYLGGAAGLVYRSDDDGLTWQQDGGWPTSRCPSAFATDGHWLAVGVSTSSETSCYVTADFVEFVPYDGGLGDFGRAVNEMIEHRGHLFKTGGISGVLWRAPLPVPTAVEPLPVAPVASLSVRPNPFNPRTRVRFALPETLADGPTRLAVHDLAGRLLRETTVTGSAGEWSWDGRDAAGRSLPSGVYLLSLEADGRELARRPATLVR